MADRSPSSPASKRKQAPRIELDVSPRGGGWSIKGGGASGALSVHGTKAEAIEAAGALMQKAGGALCVHGRDGRVLESVTLGRKAAAKTSAVEGISLEGEGRRDLEGFDSQGLSPEERRRRIGLKYAAGAKAPR